MADLHGGFSKGVFALSPVRLGRWWALMEEDPASELPVELHLAHASVIPRYGGAVAGFSMPRGGAKRLREVARVDAPSSVLVAFDPAQVPPHARDTRFAAAAADPADHDFAGLIVVDFTRDPLVTVGFSVRVSRDEPCTVRVLEDGDEVVWLTIGVG
ncbi:MAG: hypothetical protein U0325_28945 [Polyangiales bacterium]